MGLMLSSTAKGFSTPQHFRSFERLSDEVAKLFNLDELIGGPDRDRTGDLFHAMEARSQLRHRPTPGKDLSILPAMRAQVKHPRGRAAVGWIISMRQPRSFGIASFSSCRKRMKSQGIVVRHARKSRNKASHRGV